MFAIIVGVLVVFGGLWLSSMFNGGLLGATAAIALGIFLAAKVK